MFVMTSNTTQSPHVIPPITGISEAERDKYLLIGTFLSVLIIFGIIVAVMHRKCRETLSRTRSWVISKTVRHRPNFNRTSSNSRSVEMSIRDPSSPVFSKEVNAPVMFFLGSSEETSSGKTRKERRLRSSGTDHEDDSGISVISGSPNIAMCSMSNQCFCFDRDVNDNVTLTYNPSSISLDPHVNLVRVLAPEIPGSSTPGNYNKTVESERPKLRRSSTVIDKMNFRKGYMPSSRDEDFTVVTLTDESEPDCNSLTLDQSRHDDCVNIVDKAPKRQRPRYSKGLDNPAFDLKERSQSHSHYDFEVYADNRTTQKGISYTSLQKSADNVRDSESDFEHIPHRGEVHASNKIKPVNTLYKKSDSTRNYKRPTKVRTKTKIKSMDKESQELYKRVMRERIQDIIMSDSSSVKSDQTFVRTGRKKKRKLPSNPSTTTIL